MEELHKNKQEGAQKLISEKEKQIWEMKENRYKSELLMLKLMKKIDEVVEEENNGEEGEEKKIEREEKEINVDNNYENKVNNDSKINEESILNKENSNKYEKEKIEEKTEGIDNIINGEKKNDSLSSITSNEKSGIQNKIYFINMI